jgi:uncharacterized protein (DUF2384 family)
MTSAVAVLTEAEGCAVGGVVRVPVVKGLKDTIEALQRGLDVSEDALADAVGVNARSVGRWREGLTFPQREARDCLDRLSALVDRLYDTFTSVDAVRAWLYADSRYLGYLKPVDAIRAGRIDRVTAALDAFDAGLFI